MPALGVSPEPDGTLNSFAHLLTHLKESHARSGDMHEKRQRHAAAAKRVLHSRMCYSHGKGPLEHSDCKAESQSEEGSSGAEATKMRQPRKIGKIKLAKGRSSLRRKRSMQLGARPQGTPLTDGTTRVTAAAASNP